MVRQAKLSETRINLNDYDISLKPGYFYTIVIGARDKRMAMLSEAARTHAGYDFEVIE